MTAQLMHPYASVKLVKKDQFSKIERSIANPPKASMKLKAMVAKGRALKKA
jgi:hypothetical protein